MSIVINMFVISCSRSSIVGSVIYRSPYQL
jgi:hypothetical protein